MESNGFFSKVAENNSNKEIIDNIKKYTESNKEVQIYLLTAPLGENKYKYDYEENAIVILSPKHRIIFLDLADGGNDFEKYYEEFVEDLGSISDKFNYKKYIGRPKEWEKEILVKEVIKRGGNLTSLFKKEEFSIGKILEKHRLEQSLHRKSELLISLLVGSVNDLDKIGGVAEPLTLLEKIKNKIVLFDGDQTRFIYEEKNQRAISIQGLAGTGKTELLLHKLKEIYTKSDDSRIFFTCKNIALSRELNKRIPDFFNSMKVEKQIERNKRLWVNSAWGSIGDVNSGLYRYICHFYNIPFFTYGQIANFEQVIAYAITEIQKIDTENFKYAFDYILIDESQDFPENFFELCKLITKDQVYIAGDLFQDIFDSHINDREIKPDYILNKCYRTDPRTLMFAQSIGMGLFETPHLNWLQDSAWKSIGYLISKDNNNVCLSREPIRRFDDLDVDNYPSMNITIVQNDFVKDTIDIIKHICNENSTITPNDIGIIFLDGYNLLCEFANKLEFELASELKWEVNKAYENKQKLDNKIFISNQNHVKGLEFPFVICITSKIRSSYSYRNALYTMLTRSFLQSYLLIQDAEKIQPQIDGLNIINKGKCIRTTEPTSEELEKIKETIINYNNKKDVPYRDFIYKILLSIGEERNLEIAMRSLGSSKYENSFDEDDVRAYLLDIKKHF